VDLYETAEAYVLTAEIPGVDRDDIDIQTGEGRLTLSGMRRERAIACEQFHRIERGHGSFQRTFQLPLPIDHAAVTADLKDGVLTVRCPKLSEPAPRRINITP
jgi:HSP20 family protein